MNKDNFEGRWKEVEWKVKKQWGELPDDITKISSSYNTMTRRPQNTYCYQKEEVKKEINDFLNNIGWSE